MKKAKVGSSAPEWWVWKEMRARCRNKNHKDFPYYGGRGIRVCARWDRSFMSFIEDMGRRPSSLFSLDRIDNERGYSKANCRWASKKQQCRNRRSNRRHLFRGENLTLPEWAEKYKMNLSTLTSRIYLLKWPIKDALLNPVQGT